LLAIFVGYHNVNLYQVGSNPNHVVFGLCLLLSESLAQQAKWENTGKKDPFSHTDFPISHRQTLEKTRPSPLTSFGGIEINSATGFDGQIVEHWSM